MELQTFIDNNLEEILKELEKRKLVVIRKIKPFNKRCPERTKEIALKCYENNIEKRREYQRNYDREKRIRIKEQQLLEKNLLVLEN